MKTVKLLICASILSLNISLSFGQSWDWGAAGYGSPKSNHNGSPVATDNNGNAYITGQFGSSITFGSYTLSASAENVYLAKYTSSGTCLWAVQPGDSNATSFGISVATSKSGSIYVTGYFIGIIDFGAFSLTSTPGDVFLVKYSASGNVIWAKQSVSGTSYYGGQIGYSASVDKLGNIFIAGSFYDTISFGSYKLTGQNGPAVSKVFIAKYDSNGNAIWAKQGIVPNSYCFGNAYSVATDNLGNAYICGSFTDTLSFGSYRLINRYLSTSVFIVKYSSSGSVLWAKQSGNNSINSLSAGYSVITDKGNNAYITGYFQDTIKFDSNTLYSPSANSVFLTKYDANGGISWIEQSSPGWQGSSLISDKLEHIYLAGETEYGNNSDTLEFSNYKLHTSQLTNSTFVMRFDTMGKAICGSVIGNVGYYGILTLNCPGLAADTAGTYIYATGTFANDTVKCGPDTLIANNGGLEIFIGRWLDCGGDEEGVNDNQSPASSVSLFPNPNSGKFTIQSSGSIGQSSVQIYNVLGEKVYSQYSIPNTQYQIDLSSQPNGIYFYRVINEDGNLLGDGKVIIER